MLAQLSAGPRHGEWDHTRHFTSVNRVQMIAGQALALRSYQYSDGYPFYIGTVGEVQFTNVLFQDNHHLFAPVYVEYFDVGHFENITCYRNDGYNDAGCVSLYYGTQAHVDGIHCEQTYGYAGCNWPMAER